MNFKKGQVQTLITEKLVPGSGGSAVVINAIKDAQLSLAGDFSIIDVDFVLSVAMDTGSVITTRLYREAILIKTITTAVGALAASGTTRVSDAMIIKADYAEIEVSCISNAAADYTTSIFVTPLEAINVVEVSTADSANSPASAVFTIGAEAANKIIVTAQLKDILGANLTKSMFVNAYISSDTAGTTPAVVNDAIVVTAGSSILVNTAKSNLDVLTTATGAFALEIEDTSGAVTHYLNFTLPNGLVTSTAITFA